MTVHPALPRDCVRIVNEASLEELSAALFESSPALDGVTFYTYGERRIPCPRCQTTTSALLLHWPAARVVGDAFEVWHCDRCNIRGTRHELEFRVLQDPDALGRLLDAAP